MATAGGQLIWQALARSVARDASFLAATTEPVATTTEPTSSTRAACPSSSLVHAPDIPTAAEMRCRKDIRRTKIIERNRHEGAAADFIVSCKECRHLLSDHKTQFL